MAVNDKSLHMPTMSLDLEDLDRICLFLDESMVTYNFMGRSQTFLPRRALEIATQRCVIEAYLRRDQDLKLESLGFVAFLDRVYSYARKLFIICMYCDMGLPFLRSLINRHLSDKNLPLVPSDCPSPKYQRGFNSGFLRIQNHFNAAVFEKNSHQVLDDTRPIPIELPGRVECLLRKGAFGDIYRIKIHKDQHSFSSVSICSKKMDSC
jgi:hypothetical protein